MKALVCELCGSNQLMKENSVFVCQACGTQYTVEEAKKLIVEGSISIDSSKSLMNYRNLARRAREDNDTKNGEKYYSLILEQEPNDWEANFFSVYYRSMGCVVANIQSACNAVSNVLGSTFSLIMDLETNEEKYDAFKLVGSHCVAMAKTMEAAACGTADVAQKLIAAGNILATYMMCMKKTNLKVNPVLAENMTMVAKACMGFQSYIGAKDRINFGSLLAIWAEYDLEAVRMYGEECTAKRIEVATGHVEYCRSVFKRSLIWLGIWAIPLIIGILLITSQTGRIYPNIWSYSFGITFGIFGGIAVFVTLITLFVRWSWVKQANSDLNVLIEKTK